MSEPRQPADGEPATVSYIEALSWTLADALDEANEVALVITCEKWAPLAIELDRRQAREIGEALLRRVASQ